MSLPAVPSPPTPSGGTATADSWIDGVNAFLGAVKDSEGKIEVNAQTGTSYSLVASDAGKLITLSNAGAITLTVPNNTSVPFEIGTRIDIAQTGSGAVTIEQATGVTVGSAETLTLDGQYASASLVKLSTNTWMLVGRLVAAS